MKKITAYILLAALCLSLCACSLVPEAEVVVVPEQSPEVSGSPETPVPGTADDADAEAADALLAVLDELYSDYHPGTAGSSLKLAAISGKMLDWYAQYGSAGAISRASAAFAAKHADYNIYDESSEISEGFPPTLRDVWRCAAEMSFPGGDAVLADAGYSRNSEWVTADTDVFFSQLFSALALEAPERVYIYYGDLQKAAMPIDELSEHIIAAALRSAKVLPADVQINAFIHDGDHLAIDFSKELSDYLNSLDAAGEHRTLSCIVLSFLDAYSASNVMMTVDGKVLSTSYGTYDFAISRSDV